MAAAAAALRTAASSMAGIMAASSMMPFLSALASTPMPRRLVSTSRSPGRAPPLYTISSGLATPVTARPYLGSLSSIECPPASSAPASSTFSMPPRRTSPRMPKSRSAGQATRFIAVSGRAPIA